VSNYDFVRGGSERRKTYLTFLPMILFSIARLIVLHSFSPTHNAPLGALFVSADVVSGVLRMIVMEEFLSASKLLGILLRTEDVGDLRWGGPR
jgi:hypothetical protein